eukprot:jgi/Tetstr1/445944/TSEL_033573.t1
MSNEALNVTLGTHELRPWVLKMIDVKAEQEQKRTSKELKCAVDDMRKMMHNSLKKAVDALDKEISTEFASCRQEISLIASKLEEEAHARKLEAASIVEEQRLHKTELRDLESRMAAMENSLRNELKLQEAKNNESRKALSEEVRKMVADHKTASSQSLKDVKKDTKDRLVELESRVEQKQRNSHDELSQQIRLVDGKTDDCAKEMSRLSKSAEDIRREERALLEGVLSDERRARESELAKENASRKADLLQLEERVAEESRRKKEDLAEEHKQRQAQVAEMDARIAKEEEVMTRKSLSQSFQSLERRAIKHIEEMVSHKAAVTSALGSKGNASDMIAVAQALEQKSKESDERIKLVQEKLSAALLSERKARKESVAEEYNARREEITELGNAVGLDVAKLHEQLGQMAEAERRARDALARRISEERETSEGNMSAELSRLTDHFHEFRGSVDAHIEEFGKHQRAVHEALGSKGTAKDLIAVAQAIEQRAKDAEVQIRSVRNELDSRCNKLASALRESCNALSEEHEQHVAKVEAALHAKGSANELLSVAEALERKVDKSTMETSLEAVATQMNGRLSESEAQQGKVQAALQAALAAPGGGTALLQVAKELETKSQELEKLREVLEQTSSAAEMNVSALKDAIDSHADAMDVFSSDMAATVAKKLSSMQRALEGKADLSAAAACVHVSTYLKEKGIKAPKGRLFATDTARLSMEDINDIAAMQVSARQRALSSARSTKRGSERSPSRKSLPSRSYGRTSITNLY